MWTHACICTAAYQLTRGRLQCVTPSPTTHESVPSNMLLSLGGLLPYAVRNVRYIALLVLKLCENVLFLHGNYNI